MRFLPPEEQALLCRAQALGLPGASPTPAYLSPNWCTVLTLVLAVPTMGYSFLLVPILWIVQHDRTAHRLGTLRRQLESDWQGHQMT